MLTNKFVKPLEDKLTPEELSNYLEERDAFASRVETSRAWESVRRKRDELLAATDKYMTVDSPRNTPEMRAFRQVLFDIPQTYSNPNEVVWPELPEGVL